MAGGVEKTQWNNCGIMTEFLNDDGSVKSRIIEIPAIGLEASIFPFKDQDAGTAPAQAGVNPAAGEVDPADIPF
jgi:hypothetical protein